VRQSGLYPWSMAKLPDHLRGAPAGQEPVSREVLSSHQRDRVLLAATGVFAKRGYQATTVDDVLAAGKVGVGNFYSLFEGKEDCFLACYDRVLGAARRRIDEASAAAPDSDWAGRTYLGLRALLEILLAEPLEARLVLIEAQSAGPAAIGRYNALLDEAIAWLGIARERSSAARGLPAVFEQAAVSGLAYYLQQCLLDSRRHTLEELLAETAGLLLEPLIGRPELDRLRAGDLAASR
jgi:AcrR family transcriptional regulator